MDLLSYIYQTYHNFVLSHMILMKFGQQYAKRWLLCVCQCGGMWWQYTVYRLAMAAYFMAVLAYSSLVYEYGTYWIIYLENWTYLVLVVNVGLQGWITLTHTLYLTKHTMQPGNIH